MKTLNSLRKNKVLLILALTLAFCVPIVKTLETYICTGYGKSYKCEIIKDGKSDDSDEIEREVRETIEDSEDSV